MMMEIISEIFLNSVGAPRRAGNDSYSGTFEGNEAKIQFEMISYPAPDLQSIFYIGSSLIYPLSKQVELQNGARSECTSGNVYRYITTCTITLHDKTDFTLGFYTAIFNNGLGSVSLTFEIKEGVDVKGEFLMVLKHTHTYSIFCLLRLPLSIFHTDFNNNMAVIFMYRTISA